MSRPRFRAGVTAGLLFAAPLGCVTPSDPAGLGDRAAPPLPAAALTAPATPTGVQQAAAQQPAPGAPPATPPTGPGTPPAGPTAAKPAPAGPADPAVGAEPLGLDRLEQLAQSFNPILRRDAARVESARGQALQASLYKNPRFDTNNPEVFAGRNSLYNVGFQQEIVTAGKMRLDTAAANEAVKSAELTLQQNRLDMLTAVRRQYYTVLTAQRRVRVLTELAELARRSVEAGQRLQKGGELSGLDRLVFTVDAQQVQVRLRQAEAVVAGERKQLAATVGVPAVETADLAGDLAGRRPDFDEELVRRYAVTGSTLVRVAQVEIARRNVLLRRAKVEPIPNVNIGPAYQFGTTNGNDQFWLTVTFPIPAWDLNQGNIRTASADIRDAEMSLRVLQNDQLSRVADALQRYQSSRLAVEQYERDILPNVTRIQRLSEEGRLRGEFDFLRSIQAQRTVVETNLNYLDALEALWGATADVAGLLQLERIP